LCGIARGGHEPTASREHGFRKRPAQTSGTAGVSTRPST
jgi:ribosomal protein L34